MGWIISPTIPGLNLPTSWTWEGLVPDVLPPLPAEFGGPAPSLTGVVAAPVITGPAVFVTQPILGAVGPDLGTPAPAPAAGGGDSTLATLLLLGLGALAVSKMKGLRL